jgi:hypothetical protein
MTIARYGLLLLAILAVNTQTLVGQNPQQARILSLENAWNQALQIKDVKALDHLLDGEFMDIECDGTVTNKAQYMASVIAPAVQLQHIVNESMEVRFYGRSAVVIGVYLEKGTRNGKPYLHHQRFVDTWIPRNGTWLCVSSQSTLIVY